MHLYKRLHTIIFFLSLSLFAISQSKTTDSLNSLLETKIHDTTRISILQKLSKSYEINNLDSAILIMEDAVHYCNRISNRHSNIILYSIQKKKSNCLYNLGGYYAAQGDSSNQFFYLQKCQDLKSTLHDTTGLIDVYIAKGLFYSEHGKFTKALKYFNQSLKLSKLTNSKKGTAEAYNNIGYVQHNNGQINLALETYYSGLLIQEEIEDFIGAASTLNNIAFIYYQQDNFNKAFEYWQKSLGYRMQVGDKKLISHSLNNLGSIYYKQGNPKKALEYFEKSYKIQLELGDKQAGAYSLNNIGFIYNQQKDSKNAEKYWKRCLKIRRDINDKKGQVYSLHNMSSLYFNTKDYKTALSYAIEAVKLSKELGIISLEKGSYYWLYKTNLKLNKYKEAFLNYSQYIAIKDSLLNKKNTTALAEQDAKYKYDIKQIADSISHSDELKIKDISLSQQKAIVERQKVQQYALGGGIILVLIILILGYRMFRSKHKANKLLQKQKTEIEHQASELYTQNEEIQAQRDEMQFQRANLEEIHLSVKDSIAYAKNIQNAMLPQTSSLNKRFSDSFVFFKPKDVVSGDFYWWTEVESHIVITAADCTGHGVPGAFMSMLGISFLREIVNKEYITHTGVILRRLRKEIIKSLKQKSETNKLTLRDGMDMALVSINYETNILQYSGANNPIYIITNKARPLLGFENLIGLEGFYEIKPDKMPIALYDKMDRFATHEIQLEDGDQVYLFSDGYPDQFGGAKGKKFKYTPFKKLLLENSNKPMTEQQKVLNTTFETWKGIEEQVDDIIVLGIKI